MEVHTYFLDHDLLVLKQLTYLFPIQLKYTVLSFQDVTLYNTLKSAESYGKNVTPGKQAFYNIMWLEETLLESFHLAKFN